MAIGLNPGFMKPAVNHRALASLGVDTSMPQLTGEAARMASGAGSSAASGAAAGAAGGPLGAGIGAAVGLIGGLFSAAAERKRRQMELERGAAQEERSGKTKGAETQLSGTQRAIDTLLGGYSRVLT